jgi:hypothetical protein
LRLDCHNRLARHTASFFTPRSTQTVTDFCCSTIWFNEPKNNGPFRIDGFEYMREPLEWWADQLLSDGVKVWGTQSGKTTAICGGVTYTAVNNPDRFLWVMPVRDKCGEFSRTRLHPLWRKSPCTKDLIPTGRRRHDFSTFHMALGASQIDMAWSNSPTALSSNPCGVVVLDEVDKFPPGKREASPVALAEQRTKKSATPKRMKTSTPTLVDGPIWIEFLKTDQRRWWVPCPHCGKFFVMVWAKKYTIFRETGAESEVKWDAEARTTSGSWDLDKVEASARVECCHCGGHIRDAHKTQMNRAGEWRPTSPELRLQKDTTPARGYRGWHLPSLYSTAPECNFGRLARKFLQQKNSITGLQDFINSDLAEPYVGQDTRQDRADLAGTKVEITDEWRGALTVDCQRKAPYFWWIKRFWSGGNSNGVAGGSADTWEELRKIQLEPGARVDDDWVVIDSGFGARSDAEVYATCSRFGEFVARKLGKVPLHVGWMPCKGMPGKKRWKDPDSGLMVPYFLRGFDPFIDTPEAGELEMSLFEFSADYFKDILFDLRRGNRPYAWGVAEVLATDEYFRHADGEIKEAVFNPQTGRTQEVWRPRAKTWPNHLNDCEVIQVAHAVFQQQFELPE